MARRAGYASLNDGINDAGDIVGVTDGSPQTSYLYSNENFKLLAVPGFDQTSVWDINNGSGHRHI